MTFTITLQTIVWLLLVIIAFVVAIYLILFLKNATQLTADANKALQDNEQRLNDILMHLEEVTGSTAHFSKEMKKQYEKNEPVFQSIMQNSAESMVLIGDTTNRVRTLIANLNDIVGLINKLVKR